MSIDTKIIEDAKSAGFTYGLDAFGSHCFYVVREEISLEKLAKFAELIKAPLQVEIDRLKAELNALDKALRCEGWPLEARLERAEMLADLLVKASKNKTVTEFYNGLSREDSYSIHSIKAI